MGKGAIIATARVVSHSMNCDKSIAHIATVVRPAYRPILGFATEYQCDVILIFRPRTSLCAPCIFMPTFPVTEGQPTGSTSRVWPRLSWVANSLLGVPAASTASQRAFSVAARMIEERKCQLHPDTIDGLLFYTQIEKLTVFFSVHVTMRRVAL